MADVTQAPPPEVLAWAVGVLRTPIVGWRPLPQADEHGPWRIDLGDDPLPRRAVVRLGELGDGGLATEVAALGVCAMTGIPAPQVLAVDVTGGEASRPVLVESWVTGESRVPGPDEPTRGRELGRVAARIHSVALGPTDVLPERQSSLATVPFADLPVPSHAVDLFAQVREVVASTPPPGGPTVFVHGDLWQGNTLWDDGDHVGTLDWDHSGVGHPLVDIGSLRWDIAVLAGDGEDGVVAGWEEASGSRLTAEEVARGDLVAVLASPPDLALWLPNFHAQGRTDLTVEVVTTRRNAFARRALAVLTG